MDDAGRRWTADDEASVASHAPAMRLKSVEAPFRFVGRLGRGGYLVSLVAWYVACTIGFGVTLAVVLMLASLLVQAEALNAAVLAVAAVLVAVYIAGLVGYAVRRLHDLDRDGAWVVLGFVPVVGLAFGAYLLFAPGTDGANAHGDAPPTPVAVPARAPTAATIAATVAATEARLEAAYDAGRRFAERRKGGA